MVEVLRRNFLFLLVCFFTNCQGQDKQLDKINAQLDQFVIEHDYQVTENNFDPNVNLDSIVAAMNKGYVFENKNYRLDRENIDVYSRKELVDYIKQDEDPASRYSIFLSNLLPTDMPPHKKQVIFDEIKDGLDPFLIKMVESIIDKKPIPNDVILEYDWLKDRYRQNNLLLFHLYVSAHLEHRGTAQLLQSINNTDVHSNYLRWIKNNMHKKIYNFSSELFDLLARNALNTKEVDHLRSYIYLIEHFDDKYHLPFLHNGLEIIHEMPHSWGNKEQLFVQDFAYIFSENKSFKDILEFYKRLKRGDSKLKLIDYAANDFNISNTDLQKLIQLYLNEHKNKSTSLSNDFMLFLEIKKNEYRVQDVIIKDRDTAYLSRLGKYLKANSLDTQSHPSNLSSLFLSFGIYDKTILPYFFLGYHGRAFTMNKEFNEEAYGEYFSYVWRYNIDIKYDMEKLGIKTSNMFIKDSEDGKHIELGVITRGRTHSFKVNKEILRYNHLLVSFINQVLRDHGLKDRAIKTNSDIFESEDYVIMPPKKLEHMLKAYPELARI